MKNLFNNFMVDVLSMAHEDPPTGNGGSNGNSGTGTDTGGNDNGGNTEDLKNDTGTGGNPNSGSASSSGGGLTDDGRPIPDVGVGSF